jgi:hypothetical protein
MNKKIALYLVPVLLAGCVVKPPIVRKDAQSYPASTTAPLTQHTAMPAPVPTSNPAPAAPPLRLSPQSQPLVEDTVLCRVPVIPNKLRARLENEGAFAGAAKKGQGDSADYRLRAPLTVLGMPIKTISFWGDDESDAGQWVAVTVDGSAQTVVKALAAKGMKLKKVPKTDTYEYKGAKNGIVQVISEKGADIRIGCAVGLE